MSIFNGTVGFPRRPLFSSRTVSVTTKSDPGAGHPGDGRIGSLSWCSWRERDHNQYHVNQVRVRRPQPAATPASLEASCVLEGFGITEYVRLELFRYVRNLHICS